MPEAWRVGRRLSVRSISALFWRLAEGEQELRLVSWRREALRSEPLLAADP